MAINEVNKTIDTFKEFVQEYYIKKQNFEKEEREFNKVKANFYSQMSILYDKLDIKNVIEFGDIKVNTGTVDNETVGKNTISLRVIKVQKQNIKFNIPKLKKKLSKDVMSKILVKRYEVINMPELTKHLKACNVNPELFKTFLNIVEFISESEVEKLADLGMLTIEDLKGCYEVTKSEPYYKVTNKREYNKSSNIDW